MVTLDRRGVVGASDMWVRLLAIVVATIGGAGFGLPLLLGFGFTQLDRALAGRELPMGPTTVNDVAVSPSGNVYIAVVFMGRLQEYAADGSFVRSISIETEGGYFCVDLAGDRALVYVARRKAADEFDLEGRAIRLNAAVDDRAYEAACKLDGRVRSIGHSIDGVTINFADGRPPTIIRRRWWHYLAPDPLISFLAYMSGLFLHPGWRGRVFRRARNEPRS